MYLGTRIRLGLASGAVCAAAGAIALAGTVEAGAPAPSLLPDLKTIAPGSPPNIYMKRSAKTGKAALRIANRVANKGQGPLELYAQPATNDGDYECVPGEDGDEPDRDAFQRIFGDTNPGTPGYDPADEPVDERKVGCFEYHTKHSHWHFQDFARFALRDRKTDQDVVPPSRKIGFCIIDTGGRRYPDLPGSPSSGVYLGAGCGQGQPEVAPELMGLSVGYADLYSASTPGQRLEITGVPRGRYCLVSFANPPNGNADIVEPEPRANNDRRRMVKLNLERKRVRFTGQGC